MWNHLTSQLRAKRAKAEIKLESAFRVVRKQSKKFPGDSVEKKRTFGWSVNIVFSVGCCRLLAACGLQTIRPSFVHRFSLRFRNSNNNNNRSQSVCVPSTVLSVCAQTIRPATEPTAISFVLLSAVFITLSRLRITKCLLRANSWPHIIAKIDSIYCLYVLIVRSSGGISSSATDAARGAVDVSTDPKWTKRQQCTLVKSTIDRSFSTGQQQRKQQREWNVYRNKPLTISFDWQPWQPLCDTNA